MMDRIHLSTLAGVVLLALGACGAESEPSAVAQADAFIAEQGIDKTDERWRLKLTKPPKFTFGGGRTYSWVLQTSKGTLRLRFLPEVAPMHVSSTIYLTQLGFYDGLVFHRVIPTFMAQGGDPLGSGMGGPGYQYAGEFDRHARHNKAGILSMANSGPGTDGSQFFITFGPAAHLDDKHTVFGELTDGHEALKAIEALGSQSGAPRERVVIEKATIEVR